MHDAFPLGGRCGEGETAKKVARMSGLLGMGAFLRVFILAKAHYFVLSCVVLALVERSTF